MSPRSDSSPSLLNYCHRKVPYRTQAAATEALAAMRAKHPEAHLVLYRCQVCRHRHITSHPMPKDARDGLREAVRRKTEGRP